MARLLMIRPFRRRAGRSRASGQGLVELALILPIFLLILMILIDFGRVVYAQNSITQDAREAVRRGIVSTSGLVGSPTAFQARYQSIRDAAKVMAPGVPITDTSIFGAAVPCTGGLPADALVPATCFYPNGVTGTTATVVVRIQVRVAFITPIISNILGGGIDLSAAAEELIQS